MLFPSMFRGLIDLGYQRRGLEVIGFYMAYVIGSIMLGAVLGNGVAAIFGSSAVRAEWKVDFIAISILCLVLSFYSIKLKNLGTIKIMWLLPIVSAIFAIYGGPVMGLLIPTILTTRPKNHPYTPLPTSSNFGADEKLVKEQGTQPPPPPPNPEQKLPN